VTGSPKNPLRWPLSSNAEEQTGDQGWSINLFPAWYQLFASHLVVDITQMCVPDWASECSGPVCPLNGSLTVNGYNGRNYNIGSSTFGEEPVSVYEEETSEFVVPRSSP